MKELRITASEIQLRNLIYSKLGEAQPLIDEIKRQMYFDGAEDMAQAFHGKAAKVERTKVVAMLEKSGKE